MPKPPPTIAPAKPALEQDDTIRGDMMSGGDGKVSTHVELLRELIKNRQKLAPIVRLVDAHVESIDPGRGGSGTR